MSYLSKKITSSRVFNMEVLNLIKKELNNYDNFYNKLSSSVKKVLYVGMADDIISPIFAFNATEIIAVDLLDISYMRNISEFILKTETDQIKYLGNLIINQIINIIENLNGKILSYNFNTTENKSKLVFNFLGKKRVLKYYFGKNYKKFLPKEANNIDAYISIGAPSFLNCKKHLKKVSKILTNQSYLLIASNEKSPIGDLIYTGNISINRKLLSIDFPYFMIEILNKSNNFGNIEDAFDDNEDCFKLYKYVK